MHNISIERMIVPFFIGFLVIYGIGKIMSMLISIDRTYSGYYSSGGSKDRVERFIEVLIFITGFVAGVCTTLIII
jgi:hypothetical protein